MPIVNRVADFHAEISAWRHDIHAHPELLFDVHRTAGVVAEKLKSFGCDEVVTGIGRTGVVGVIRGKTRRRTATVSGCAPTWMRCRSRRPPACPTSRSTRARCMPAATTATPRCCSAPRKYLAETRNFAGTAVVIFQPAEEGGGGGREMVNDGMMDRFKIEEVYGMHNYPGLPVGDFAIRSGPMMAAADRIYHRHRGPWRPRGAAAHVDRYRAGGRGDRQRLQSIVVAQCRSAGIGGGVDLPCSTPARPTTSFRRPRSCAAPREA